MGQHIIQLFWDDVNISVTATSAVSDCLAQDGIDMLSHRILKLILQYNPISWIRNKIEPILKPCVHIEELWSLPD